MGIPRLTKHLVPHAESVYIGHPENDAADCKYITSVVIDGPALVYHVYHCLLSYMDQQYNPLDAQPSCDEVSVGVMRFLLYLRDLDINM